MNMQFLGTLVDMNASVRLTSRKALRLTKFDNMPMFKLAVDSLIHSLDIYPQVSYSRSFNLILFYHYFGCFFYCYLDFNSHCFRMSLMFSLLYLKSVEIMEVSPSASQRKRL